jgi:hypothetical protein
MSRVLLLPGTAPLVVERAASSLWARMARVRVAIWRSAASARAVLGLSCGGAVGARRRGARGGVRGVRVRWRKRLESRLMGEVLPEEVVAAVMAVEPLECRRGFEMR